MCARHIYGNLRRAYPGKELPKDLFWAVAKSFNIGDYEVALQALKNFDVRVYEAVLMKNPQNCSRAFFSSTSVCEDVSNNFSESYNNTLNTAREMPLVEMLETVRRQAMIRMDMRKTNAFKWQGKYSEKVSNAIKAEKKYMIDCRVIPSGNGIYEVGENNHAHTVNMVEKTCVCRRWSMTGIPCRHALRVIVKKKLDPLDYVSHWYLTSTWRKQYSDPIRPVNGINFWRSSGENTIEPPPRDVPQPTKKEKKRFKGKNESPKKKKKGKGLEAEKEKRIKLTIEGRTSTCGRCGHGGHNSRKCPNHGCPVFRPRKPPSEGPSQSSQNSNRGGNIIVIFLDCYSLLHMTYIFSFWCVLKEGKNSFWCI